MLFWIERLVNRAPKPDSLIDATKETMLYAVEKLGFQRVNAGSNVPYFGRADIIDLVDFDSKNSKFSDLAQQHHLAWTIAWACGVKPSSLGDAKFCWVKLFNSSRCCITDYF